MSRKPKTRRQAEPITQTEAPLPLVLHPKKFDPKGKNQIAAQKAWKAGKNLFLHGFPGTGKTYIAIAMAVSEVRNPDSPVDKIVICRSAVQGRDIGFLKGSAVEKMEAFESPYIEAVNSIYDNPGAYEHLKKLGKIVFIPTSFERGNNIANAVLILDEIQNYSFMEAHTLITRPKDHTRVIIAGDTAQDDLTNERKKETSCIRLLSKIINEMASFDRFEFSIDDVMRSDFVKEYLIAKDKVERKMEEKKDKKQLLREIPDEENDPINEEGETKPEVLNE